MKLGAICLVRNEIDIAELFLRHLDALMDEVIILDHLSFDGTSDLLQSACRQRKFWHYFKLTFKQKLQTQLIDFFIEKLQGSNLDFLFLLDVDEFILVKDRKELEVALTAVQPGFVGNLGWAYGIPQKSVKHRLKMTSLLRVSDTSSKFSKVVIPGNLLRKGGLRVSKGNHVVYDENWQVIPTQTIARLLHIPIRSESQLIRKTLIKAVDLVTDMERQPGESYQYDHFLRLIRDDHLCYDTLLQALVIYENDRPSVADNPELQKFLKTSRIVRASDLIATSNSLVIYSKTKQVPLEVFIADAMLDTKSMKYSLALFQIDGNNINLVNSEH